MLALNNQYAHNPYATMTQTTNSVKNNIRNDVFLPYSGITDNIPSCMYSGVSHQKVRCAHILPGSAKMRTVTNLGLKPFDINCARNLMWLCPGIEDAFDSQKLSFVRRLLPGLVTGYVMLVWDESCLDDNLGVDSEQTIGNVYEKNKSLNFSIIGSAGVTKTHNVFKRCLANQAIWCHHTHKNGQFPDSIWTHGDFSSVGEDVHQILCANEYISNTMLLSKEIEIEIEEEKEEE